jgi:putative transposase
VKSHKTRIYPNKEQIKLLEKCFGYRRFCYNRGLALWNDLYSNGIKPNGRIVRDKCKRELKEEWEDEYIPIILDSAVDDLNEAFNRFIKGKGGKPRFDSLKKGKFRFRIYRKNKYTIRIKEGKIILPKFKEAIKLAEEPRFNGNIKNCTISKRANKYFISFNIDVDNEEEIVIRKKTNRYIGIDLGVKDFATLAYDRKKLSKKKGLKVKKFNYPKELLTLKHRIKKQQKILSRKEKSSNNYKVMKTKLQNSYLKMNNIKDDFLHKLTSMITKRFDIITIEDLNVKGMLKNKYLSSSIYEALFYKFKLFLEYKSEWYKNKLAIADRFFPSSQICSNCGRRKKGTKKLKLNERIYKCKCGNKLNRDDNAAFNLRNLGIEKFLGLA